VNGARAIVSEDHRETVMPSDEINEKAEEAATDEATRKSVSRPKIMAPTGHGSGVMSRGSDLAAKPGFRDASNTRSKASKKKRRKK